MIGNTLDRDPYAEAYMGFAELASCEMEGVDYEIISEPGIGTGIAFIAPHGGGIEPGTTEIARFLADGKHAFYSLVGKKETEGINQRLHITSKLFDEPRGLEMARSSRVVITIHGTKVPGDNLVIVGGMDEGMGATIIAALRQEGFNAVTAANYPQLRGIDPSNICNRGMTGKGCQLELSRNLREGMLSDMGRMSGFKRAIDAALAAVGNP